MVAFMIYSDMMLLICLCLIFYLSLKYLMDLFVEFAQLKILNYISRNRTEIKI